jgi:hypothetical protein
MTAGVHATRGAISAVDVALWDLKARILGLPLHHLLGAVRDSVPVDGKRRLHHLALPNPVGQVENRSCGAVTTPRRLAGREVSCLAAR